MGASTVEADTAVDQDINDRIADAEADVARAQARLERLRRANADAAPASPSVTAPRSPDDIVDAVAAESAAEAQGTRPSAPAAALLYQDAPFVPAKDHVAAGLLAILLGCFGIHKFYLGYTTAGFITLAITIVGGVFTLGVTAAVMAIVGVVEGVLYLTVSQSTFECTHVEHVREWF